jgi:hypothetical protein
MQVCNLGSCYAFFAGLGLIILFTPNAPSALIAQIQRVGTHTMWRGSGVYHFVFSNDPFRKFSAFHARAPGLVEPVLGSARV